MSNASIKSYNRPYSRSKSRGKGWHEKSVYVSSINRKVAPKHRKAALGGSPGRQGSIPSSQIHRKMDRRSKRAQLIDRSKQAKRVGSVRSKKDKADWKHAPARMDLQGIDTRIAKDQYKAKVSKQKLKQKRQVRRKITKQIVKKKEQVKQVKKPEEKQKIQKEIKEKEQEKEKVELDIKNVEVGHRKVKKSIHEKSEEKHEVMYIMKTTDNNNYVECDALRERAKNNDVDYDHVDWEQMQGKDLTYNDRVRRLDNQIGKTHTDEEAYHGHEEERYAQMQEDWQRGR